MFWTHKAPFSANFALYVLSWPQMFSVKKILINPKCHNTRILMYSYNKQSCEKTALPLFVLVSVHKRKNYRYWLQIKLASVMVWMTSYLMLSQYKDPAVPTREEVKTRNSCRNARVSNNNIAKPGKRSRYSLAFEQLTLKSKYL